MKFIDETDLKLFSGKGGAGCVSFRREWRTPRGGPDGGDGGKGGDVLFYGDPNLNSLIDLHSKRQMRAENGQPGEGQKKTGAEGSNLIIPVPPGTLVIDKASKNVLLDVESEKHHQLLAGGRGGKGNTFFKTSVNQAPQRSQPGEPGEEIDVHLELKLIADVGLIGYPNAGKSTLISSISAAKPKIADYPFTTLTPNLGVVKFGEGQSFVVADIPGLIKGAHEGVGLGIQFLRHIERTRVFIHVIDTSDMSGREPYQDYLDINEELRKYEEMTENMGQPLTQRPQIVVLNKVDTINEQRLFETIDQFKSNGVETMYISAVTGKNTKELVGRVGDIVLKK